MRSYHISFSDSGWFMCVYFSSEYGYMIKITEKSDVYSFGVVMLEVLTGKKPINDASMPEGLHISEWVKEKRGQLAHIIDLALLQSSQESEIGEMKEALGIALLCLSPAPNQRPSMRDVATMIKEIKQVSEEEYADFHTLLKEDSPTPLTGPSNATPSCLYPKSPSPSSPRRSSISIVELG